MDIRTLEGDVEAEQKSEVRDGDFFWDWAKHEENLLSNRANFFSVGEAMLVAAWATLRVDHEAANAARAVCFVGLVVSALWFTVGWFHLKTRKWISERVDKLEKRRGLVKGEGWMPKRPCYWFFASGTIMSLWLPAFLFGTWIYLGTCGAHLRTPPAFPSPPQPPAAEGRACRPTARRGPLLAALGQQ